MTDVDLIISIMDLETSLFGLRDKCEAEATVSPGVFKIHSVDRHQEANIHEQGHENNGEP